MARIANFTSAGTSTDPTGGMTLDGLMARQKMLAEQAQQIAAPRDMPSPWQGAAQLAQAFVNARQGGQAQEQMMAGRDALAKIRSGINLDTGPTSDQIGQASTLDPHFADNLTQMAVEMIRSKREREQHLADVSSSQTFQSGQQQNQQDFQAGQTKEKQAYDQSQPVTDIGKIDQELANGRITQAEADQAKATLAPVTYRPATQSEIDAYHLNPSLSYRVNSKTGEPEAIGSPMQLLPAEFASKIALGDEFLSNFDNIRTQAASGSMTGPVDYATSSILGRGEGGQSYRQLKQGSEALLRMLTGAGVSDTEAVNQVKQYEPSPTDDAPTLVSKIDGLKNAMVRIRQGATAGRASIPMPESKPAAPGATPPPGAPPAPGATPPAASGGGVPSVAANDLAGYRALPPGAQYTVPGHNDPNGGLMVFIKPAAAATPSPARQALPNTNGRP